MAINAKTAKLDLNNQLTADVLRLIHYFAKDTTDKILEHIDRLAVRDTGTLRDSIRSTVMMNAGGNTALASFYFVEYAPYVEMAVGKYWGVDADLGKGVGVKKTNIDIPQVGAKGYGPLTASFSGLPGGRHGTLREKTHRPRPFLRIEINRQVERISWRLLEQCANTMEIHMFEAINQAAFPNVPGNIFTNEGFVETTASKSGFAGFEDMR